MDQRSIVLYLTRKDLAPRAIRGALVATIGSEAVSYSSVTRYVREAILAASNPIPLFSQPTPQLDDCDSAILLALAEQPFASILQLARLICLPKTIVNRRLTQSLGFRVRHFRCIPHTLSQAQKVNRVSLS
jgi:hypothetical protein